MSYRNATRLAIAYLLTLVVLVATLVAMVPSNADAHAPSVDARHASVTLSLARTCGAEDSPGWDWATCGNLARGVRLYPSARTYARRVGAERLPWGAYLVDAAAFCRLDRRGAIDWTRTPHVPGDAIARAHGCDPRLFAQPGE